jgi:sulfur carrier protein
MEVTVNQKTFEVPEQCSIEEMLTLLPHLPAKGIAVALNQNIVAKSAWPEHVLRSGDQVMIIKATQGG